MRKMMLIGLLVAVVALTGTAYAEVQNIKVGGDIDMKAIIHNNYDLKDKRGNIPGPIGSGLTPSSATPTTNDDNANFFLSTVRVTVDADLTDNVSTHVRLLNQRVWDAFSTDETVHLDNAYVVLKEFLYSPLTVIAGRQNLKYGTGFIVGDGLLADPEGIFTAVDTNGIHAAGIGAEHSAYNAYDAIRVILDFAPITVEGVMAKINETGVATNDQDLFGAVVNYKLDQWNAEIEPYWFYKHDAGAALSFQDSTAVSTYDINNVHTIGLRLAGQPIENLWVNLEGAGQLGEVKEATFNLKRDRVAYAANVDIRYTWAQAPWTPNTGIGWVYYSGEEGVGPNNSTAPSLNQLDTYNGWDPMYRGQFTTWVQEFLGGFGAGNLYTTADVNDTASNTNRHLLYGDVTLKPIEDVTLWARYTHAWFAEVPVVGRSSTAGDEIDVKANYAYTDDVNLTLAGGWFLPGGYYDDNPNKNAQSSDLAWTLIGGANVKF